ncbi:MAG: DUF4404 family protein [Sinobacteraceae bacterium]|nr:DUF4404 family protein [Nevskiaceae bacterium]
MSTPGPHDPDQPATDKSAMQSALDRLREAGTALGSQPGSHADHAAQLVAELEQQVQNNNTPDLREAMRQRVQASIHEFEAEHPDFTAALSQFLLALGSMGI